MSLYQQLAALHAAQPSASYDELKRDIKVGAWTLSSADCPAVAAQLKAYEVAVLSSSTWRIARSLGGPAPLRAAFDACIASGAKPSR